ncbi:MAG: ATP-binding protein [Alphaproteobacteria bacterium]
MILTIAFVMLAEVLIYAPSIGRFRKAYLEEHIASAHLATLVLISSPDHMIDDAVKEELLRTAGAHGIVLERAGARTLALSSAMPPAIDLTVDLTAGGFFTLIGDAFATLAQTENRALRVMGKIPGTPQLTVEVVMEEAPMRAAMLDYSRRILALSIVISLITAGLVFAALQWMIVTPLRRTTASMTAFRKDPENALNIIHPSPRSDEIGTAQRELAVMQEELHITLGHRARLAALGTAVAKINHDLRNMLATAQLVSERLADSGHPEAKKWAPRMIDALDRAIRLCTQTLDFARQGVASIQLARLSLAALLADAAAETEAVATSEIAWDIHVPESLEIEGDRDQLLRVFVNLGKNAAEAGAKRIEVDATARNGAIEIRFADDGPGIPETARDTLFTPFTGSARDGGTGLGLAIARDILRAHGGMIELGDSGESGTVFRFTLPRRIRRRRRLRAT